MHLRLLLYIYTINVVPSAEQKYKLYKNKLTTIWRFAEKLTIPHYWLQIGEMQKACEIF